MMCLGNSTGVIHRDEMNVPTQSDAQATKRAASLLVTAEQEDKTIWALLEFYRSVDS
jgi:hypothetical protein